VLSDVIAFLRCPACGSEMTAAAAALRCSRGHSYDVARQGYVSFLSGRARAGATDTAGMVRARASFLAAGHYAPLASRLAELAAGVAGGGLVVDGGAGTGYFLAAVLDRLPTAVGLAVDISKPALRRAARVSARAAALAWDVWRPIPLRSRCAALVLDVLAPRNAPEFRRILADDGALVIASPTPLHLGELVGPLGMLSVDAEKDERMERSLSPLFQCSWRETVATEMLLSRAEVESAVLMGPSAHHVAPEELRRRAAALPEPVRVTASFQISLYRPLT
jgi:23S rRNA (guanine745-N1)-methyltransferase